MSRCSVDGCERPCKGRGYCSLHYQRWYAHGDPLVSNKGHSKGGSTNMPHDVWRFVQKGASDECWPWLAARGRRGYGSFTLGKKRRVATRVIYALVYGVEPGGLLVCHHCDNPPCCNPAHLFLGDAQANSLDMHRKNRGRSPRGRVHHASKLVESEVVEIRARRARGEKLTDLAAEFGVSKSRLSEITRHPEAAWSHVK
jgi:hypothetical protein